MAPRYDLAMSEPVAEQLSEDVQQIVQGYTFDEPASELGVRAGATENRSRGSGRAGTVTP